MREVKKRWISDTAWYTARLPVERSMATREDTSSMRNKTSFGSPFSGALPQSLDFGQSYSVPERNQPCELRCNWAI